MMEQIDSNILIMFAHVTATLIGFAFLTPLINGISSGLFTTAGIFIKNRILYKRVLGLASLPVFVFFGVFLNSILLLAMGESIHSGIKVLCIVFALFYWQLFFMFYRGLRTPGRIIWLFEKAPLLLLGPYMVYAIISFYYHLSFDFFIYLTNLLFIFVGLLLILQLFMTPFDKGLWFKPSQINIDWICDVEKEFNSIKQALKSRESLVNSLTNMVQTCYGQMEWYNVYIAKRISEITFLREQYKGPRDKRFEGLLETWKRLRLNDENTLNDLFQFDDDRGRIVEEYLPEFERTTEEIKNLLKSKHIEQPITETSPLFSVVIPTRGRCDLVQKLLISLQKAIVNSGVQVEVIIVDDSPPEERDNIEAFCWQYGAQYLSGSPSVSEKRNRGIEKSRGKYILFTDSDCEVSPNIFDEHLKVYAEADTAGVLGITKFTGKENITWKIVGRTMFLDSFSFAETLSKDIDSAPWGPCTNLSFRKEVLEKVGKFDTTLPFGSGAGGEDTELGVRINEVGYKIKMNPNAVVFHTRETWSRLGALFKKAFRWGRADFHILKKHPKLGQVAFPSFFTVLLLIALACSAYILTGHSNIAVMIIIIWMLSTLLIDAIIKIIRAGERLHLVFSEFMATLLNLAFDAGAVFESLRRGSLSMLYKRIIYIPAMLISEWESEAVRSWSITIGLLLTLIVVWILKGV